MKPLQHPIIFLEEKIHRKNNQLLIKFDYDETLISLIRSILLKGKMGANIVQKVFEVF